MGGGREHVPRDQSTLVIEARFLGGHESAITTIMIIKHCRYGWGFTCISPFLLDIFKRFAFSGKIFLDECWGSIFLGFVCVLVFLVGISE